MVNGQATDFRFILLLEVYPSIEERLWVFSCALVPGSVQAGSEEMIDLHNLLVQVRIQQPRA